MPKAKNMIFLGVVLMALVIFFGVINKKDVKNTSKTNVGEEATATIDVPVIKTKEPFGTLPPAKNDPEMSIVDDEEMQEETTDKNIDEELSKDIKADMYFYEQLIDNYLTAHTYYLKGSKDFLRSMIDNEDYLKSKESQLNKIVGDGIEQEYNLVKIGTVKKEKDFITVDATIKIGTKGKNDSIFIYKEYVKWYKIKKSDDVYVFIGEGTR